jgi:hypothetical protein
MCGHNTAEECVSRPPLSHNLKISQLFQRKRRSRKTERHYQYDLYQLGFHFTHL